MEQTGPTIALVETVEQASIAASRHPHAIVVAMTPGTDFWREESGRNDPVIEDLFDERDLYPIGDEVIDRVEKMADCADAVSQSVLTGLDRYRDISLRAYFHFLKQNFDSFVIRVEQIHCAFDTLKPARLLTFPHAWAMAGLSVLDKPPLGMTTMLAPVIASQLGIAIEPLPAPVPVSAPVPVPRQECIARKWKVWMRGFEDQIRTWRRRLLRTCRVSRPDSDTTLIHSLFGDLGESIVRRWTSTGDKAVSIAAYQDRIGPSQQSPRLVRLSKQIWARLEKESKFRRYFQHRGVDLWPWLGPLVKQIVQDCYPSLLQVLKRSERALRSLNAVMLSGGMVDVNYVYGRVSHRLGIPFVSHHYGGFLGYALLPTHERYDMAECDYFACGGSGAAECFATPSAPARWRRETRRARPVATGMAWIQDLMNRYRAETPNPRPIQRIMVILNGLVGDCRYLGYVFPPEIAYWRFTKRLIERLSTEPIEVIVKPPLTGRYPQQVNPLEQWLEGIGRSNVRILREVPLADCMAEADAFIVESPSTPLLNLVATRAAMLLYIDRDVYRLTPVAQAALVGRCQVFAEDKEVFFRRLEAFLRDVRSGTALTDSMVDDTFLRRFAICGNEDAAARLCSLLRLVAKNHPLSEKELAAFESINTPSTSGIYRAAV